MKFPAAVVSAGPDKICQHFVGVGGAYQLPDGKAHFPPVISGQNIPKVSSGNHHIHGLSHRQSAGTDQFQIGVNVIYNLRKQASPVDGVRTGKLHAVLSKPLL